MEEYVVPMTKLNHEQTFTHDYPRKVVYEAQVRMAELFRSFCPKTRAAHISSYYALCSSFDVQAAIVGSFQKCSHFSGDNSNKRLIVYLMAYGNPALSGLSLIEWMEQCHAALCLEEALTTHS